MLCDIGASEIAMPLPWFANDAHSVVTGADLAELARKYVTSPEATRRPIFAIRLRPAGAKTMPVKNKVGRKMGAH